MAMPGQRSRMGAVWNGTAVESGGERRRATAVPKSGNTIPEFEHSHRCMYNILKRRRVGVQECTMCTGKLEEFRQSQTGVLESSYSSMLS